MSTVDQTNYDSKHDELAAKPLKRIGITLVTGFLGAGKSTLIRRILTEHHSLRIVVVENEFGENATVEQAIVTQGLGKEALENFIELPNGCICCSAQDDLTDALQRLVKKKRGAFDHVLIEASGLTDPAIVVASFWLDEGLLSDLYLDAVVTVVDSINFPRSSFKDALTRSIIEKQVAMADVILQNKIDLTEVTCDNVGEEKRKNSVVSLIRKHNQNAQVIPTTKCNVDLRQLFNIRAYDSDSAQQAVLKWEGLHHGHEESINTTTISFERDYFDKQRLDRVFGELLWESHTGDDSTDGKLEIWRMKALVTVKDEMQKIIYQSVHTLFDSTESSVVVDDDKRLQSKFVFIGVGIKREFLESMLRTAIVEHIE